MSHETQPTNNFERSPDEIRSLEEAGAERRSELEKAHETESTPDDLERAKFEALEQAAKIEKEATPEETAERSPAEQRGPQTTRKAAEISFKQTMKHTQNEMSTPSRAFSKVIHNKTVEKASETLGSTVARPNAILSGAVFAFVITLVIYLIAKNLGYPLSGFESIAAFVLGWVVGIVFDFLRVMITGKR